MKLGDAMHLSDSVQTGLGVVQNPVEQIEDPIEKEALERVKNSPLHTLNFKNNTMEVLEDAPSERKDHSARGDG